MKIKEMTANEVWVLDMLKADGFDYVQIANSMCDGDVLTEWDITEDESENIYNFCGEQIKIKEFVK
jgi:hypothetical protein